ncbi:MAG: DNA polymerase, partial [Gordonia amarae]
AERLVADIQRVNAIVLARTARGYAVDRDYLDRFLREHGAAWQAAHRRLQEMGVRPGQGFDIITALDQRGELPPNWPRTEGGRLSADKKAMERLEKIQGDNKSPMIAAHQEWSEYKKTFGYVSKVLENAAVTGRAHPEFNILGASATGRMSCSSPELQQFTDAARGVIVADDDDEWVSVDWKSIEPVVMATAAGDGDFLSAMRAGADPYEPIGEMVGIGRKPAKQLMLSNLYGSGVTSAAAHHSLTEEKVAETFAALRAELPVIYRLIDALKTQSVARSYVTTLAGRVLNQDMWLPAEQRTVTKSYVAPNHFCQGSALDVMHHSILALDDLGLSDRIHLWLHDELVADKSIEAALVEVMSTPPPFLAEAAARNGIAPFLAVDANDLGRYWKSV